MSARAEEREGSDVAPTGPIDDAREGVQVFDVRDELDAGFMCARLDADHCTAFGSVGGQSDKITG